MVIFVSIKKLIQTFWWLIAGIALYIFYQTIGLNMFFLLVIGLLALKFVPVLFLPVLLITLVVYFSGGFSFIADFLEAGIVMIIGVPFVFITWMFIDEQIKVFKEAKKLKTRETVYGKRK
ncbi:hypothetical protein DAD66_05665 [Streptococcus agalactiae]|uniref:hypothetical protein n=1 Tax=Streptococcus agalactiae TaxID=1311 RepID=UPI0011448918|nr:hypothetical protein [Streptococcus agalactiae]MCC9674551.1 hypothetical protein [Streptococcus agalactiae]MCC9745558.1 hypothetical protein [Streptococcus agalactiae]TQB91638.1 hypothetical protein DAD74_00275 [Streptococcus agalactiae]TQC00580.1 hypothetical protein DAD71_00085 [Streptococcus agalactiae]TQC03981.1 hypothetical protein DAD66_05665 [Streptococcus agalactiae]